MVNEVESEESAAELMAATLGAVWARMVAWTLAPASPPSRTTAHATGITSKARMA